MRHDQKSIVPGAAREFPRLLEVADPVPPIISWRCWRISSRRPGPRRQTCRPVERTARVSIELSAQTGVVPMRSEAS